MVQWRSIDKGYDEYISKDPGSSLSKHCFRQMVLNGTIPSIKVGVKRLIDIETLDEHLKNPKPISNISITPGIIRPVSDKRA